MIEKTRNSNATKFRRRRCCNSNSNNNNNSMLSVANILRKREYCCRASNVVVLVMMILLMRPQQYSNAFSTTSSIAIETDYPITRSRLINILGTALGGGGGKKQYTCDGSVILKEKKKSKNKTRDIEYRVNEDRSRWLSWMTRGTKITKTRNVDEIRMREAEELGGVPRSDRYSSCDWFHNTLSLPNSQILKAIRGPVLFMTCWAGFLSVVYRHLSVVNPSAAKLMCLSSTPHSLMSSALSLLLVFKTNSAYQRFAEGRKIWENIINNSRDLYRMLNLYEVEMGRKKRRRLQRLLAAFPYLLRHRIRPNLIMYRVDDEANVRNPEHSIVLYQDKASNDLDPEAAAVATQEENEGNSRRRRRPLYWVDKRTLPWRLLPSLALEPCARSQNRPLWVCDRMAHELRSIPDGPCFTSRERLTLISKVEKLSNSIGACERIHQTAVPLNYARHSLRALSIWLFTLPFCLVQSLEFVTAPAIFIVSWLMFGVYEIGYSIEDPFQGTLRLSVLCDTIRRDVLADEVIRSTAFENDEESVQLSPSSDQNDESNNQSTETVEHVEEEEEIDYESSPIVKESRQVLVIEKNLPKKKNLKRTIDPLLLEDVPVLRNINSNRDLNYEEVRVSKKRP